MNTIIYKVQYKCRHNSSPVVCNLRHYVPVAPRRKMGYFPSAAKFGYSQSLLHTHGCIATANQTKLEVLHPSGWRWGCGRESAWVQMVSFDLLQLFLLNDHERRIQPDYWFRFSIFFWVSALPLFCFWQLYNLSQLHSGLVKVILSLVEIKC